MCVTAAVVLVGAALASTAVSIQGAQDQKAYAKYENQLRQKQITDARNQSEIQALNAENERTREYRATKSSALAAIGASGLGENISYLQGLAPDDYAAYLNDVRAVRLNLIAEQSGLNDESQASKVGYRAARRNANRQTIGAVADFVTTVGKTYYGMSETKKPKGN